MGCRAGRRPAAERVSAASSTVAATPPGLQPATTRRFYGIVGRKSRDNLFFRRGKRTGHVPGTFIDGDREGTHLRPVGVAQAKVEEEVEVAAPGAVAVDGRPKQVQAAGGEELAQQAAQPGAVLGPGTLALLAQGDQLAQPPHLGVQLPRGTVNRPSPILSGGTISRIKSKPGVVFQPLGTQ